jgi:hypothetical protein
LACSDGDSITALSSFGLISGSFLYAWKEYEFLNTIL